MYKWQETIGGKITKPNRMLRAAHSGQLLYCGLVVEDNDLGAHLLTSLTMTSLWGGDSLL